MSNPEARITPDGYIVTLFSQEQLPKTQWRVYMNYRGRLIELQRHQLSQWAGEQLGVQNPRWNLDERMMRVWMSL